MQTPKEFLSRYIKLSKFRKSGTKGSSTNLQRRICAGLQETASKNPTHRRIKRAESGLHALITDRGFTD